MRTSAFVIAALIGLISAQSFDDGHDHYNQIEQPTQLWLSPEQLSKENKVTGMINQWVSDVDVTLKDMEKDQKLY